MWYTNNYRRHLCDIHIEDWNEEFLSAFSPEEYFKNLKLANVSMAMIYFQSHVGYCYFPTKVGHMHNALKNREDVMKKLVGMCMSDGIRVMGYYSIIYNTWAELNHPEWAMINCDGKKIAGDLGSRYGLCCPNNPGYREFVKIQIKEMADFFDFDGIFFDMPFWPCNCYCKYCKERFKSEYGLDSLPKDINDFNWDKNVDARARWMGDFTGLVYREVKKYLPDTPVEFNFAAAMSNSDNGMYCTDFVNENCDYCGGDLYGGFYYQSYACKFYRNVTKNPPFEYMTSRCNPNLYKHTVTRSHDMLTLATGLTFAHHGAMLMIDAIDPVGTMDSRVYEKIGEVYRNLEPYEKYFYGELVSDIAIYHNLRRKSNVRGEAFINSNAGVNLAKTLTEEHIPYDVLATSTLDKLEKYKILAVPYAFGIPSDEIDMIIKYVENGGNLYFSGAEEQKLLETFFGAKKTGYTDENITYVTPVKGSENMIEGYGDKYPIPFDISLPILEGYKEFDVMAKIILPYTKPGSNKFSSIHSNPPGIKTDYPAVLMTKYGKGKVIWSGAPIENEKIYDYKMFIIKIFEELLKECNDLYIIKTNAPRDVEIVTFKTPYEYLLNAVHLSEEDLIPEVNSFNIKIKSEKIPKSIVILPGNKLVNFSYDNGFVSFNTQTLDILDVYAIKF